MLGDHAVHIGCPSLVEITKRSFLVFRIPSGLVLKLAGLLTGGFGKIVPALILPSLCVLTQILGLS